MIARLEGFEPTTPGSEVWRMMSQMMILRIKQTFCVNCQNPVLFVKCHQIITRLMQSISKLLAKFQLCLVHITIADPYHNKGTTSEQIPVSLAGVPGSCPLLSRHTLAAHLPVYGV